MPIVRDGNPFLVGDVVVHIGSGFTGIVVDIGDVHRNQNDEAIPKQIKVDGVTGWDSSSRYRYPTPIEYARMALKGRSENSRILA